MCQNHMILPKIFTLAQRRALITHAYTIKYRITSPSIICNKQTFHKYSIQVLLSIDQELFFPCNNKYSICYENVNVYHAERLFVHQWVK